MSRNPLVDAADLECVKDGDALLGAFGPLARVFIEAPGSSAPLARPIRSQGAWRWGFTPEATKAAETRLGAHERLALADALVRIVESRLDGGGAARLGAWIFATRPTFDVDPVRLDVGTMLGEVGCSSPAEVLASLARGGRAWRACGLPEPVEGRPDLWSCRVALEDRRGLLGEAIEAVVLTAERHPADGAADVAGSAACAWAMHGGAAGATTARLSALEPAQAAVDLAMDVLLAAADAK